jgi:hypothetical protein
MIFIQFEAMPSEAISENAAGAYVNCWINTESAPEAEALARQWIAEEGWSVLSIEERRTVDLASEIKGPAAKRIEEALQSGASIVFTNGHHEVRHLWAETISAYGSRCLGASVAP